MYEQSGTYSEKQAWCEPDAPPYSTATAGVTEDGARTEKTSPPHCQIHTNPPTPHLSAHLSTPTTQALLHSLIATLTSGVDGTSCPRCATEGAARTLTTYFREMHEMKKSGKLSKEERKAVKAEVKGLLKMMKGDLKRVWKEGK